MPAMSSKIWRGLGALATAALLALVVNHVVVLGQSGESETMLTYSRGQPIMPVYNGWHPLPDGTIDLWFGYINFNHREETDVPVGANNSVVGPPVVAPDGGQPTHFFPRNNRYVFRINVPKDYGNKEVVWTVTSHGKTYQAYASLRPQYIRDDEGMQREYFGGGPADGNEAPKISIDGEATRTLKVGDVSLLNVLVTDDGKPQTGRGGAGAAAAAAAPPPAPPAGGAAAAAAAAGRGRPSICGTNTQQFFCGEPNEGAGALFSVKGLRMSCFLYRGDPGIRVSSREDFGQATLVAFDPPQEKIWEDHVGGSPWASGYVLPPVPKDNIWKISTSFGKAGTFVVRCQANDGLLTSFTDVTFRVTP